MPNPAADRLFTWAGGKSKLLPHYRPLLPQDVYARQLHEPFAGGAALFNALASESLIDASLTDINDEIIGLYKLVRDNPEYLISQMHSLEAQWLARDREARKSLYYDLRAAYWQMQEGPEATALLYFLMKTGFNGIWQTCKASKGRYGTPVGLATQKTSVFNPDVVKSWSVKLNGVYLQTCGYAQAPIADNGFVFCDPPYRDSFTSYGTAFDDSEQLRLIAWCRHIHESKNAVVWLSNRDAGDGFFEAHAQDAELHRFPVTYTAGRRKKTEGGFEAKPATEILLIWR